HYKALKGVSKPYSKPQQQTQTLLSYDKEYKLIDKNNIPDFDHYKNKTLITVIYHSILLSFNNINNLNDQITT
ncbi:6333_t:CDS:1, partial [Cetraspora pellucida]